MRTQPNLTTRVLHAQCSASAYDECYEMAFVYCQDPAQRYSFSLTRYPERDEMELMVSDQVLTQVNDLDLSLGGSVLTARLDAGVADQLDGTGQYVIHLEASDEELQQLVLALEKIFEGKQGFKRVL